MNEEKERISKELQSSNKKLLNEQLEVRKFTKFSIFGKISETKEDYDLWITC